MLAGLRDEHGTAELCRQEIIGQGMYCSWSKEFLEAGKKRLAGDTSRAATTDEVKHLRRQTQDLKKFVTEQALELRPANVVAPDQMYQFRFPFGACTKAALRKVNERGLMAIR